jgi:hypothetical protein
MCPRVGITFWMEGKSLASANKPHTVQPHDHHYIHRDTTILTVPSMMTAGDDGYGKMESNNLETHGSYTTYHTCTFYWSTSINLEDTVC